MIGARIRIRNRTWIIREVRDLPKGRVSILLELQDKTPSDKKLFQVIKCDRSAIQAVQ